GCWDLIYNIIDEQKKIIANTPKDQLRNDMINILLTANTDHDVNISKNRVKNYNPEYQRPMNDKELLLNLLEAIVGGVDAISNFFNPKALILFGGGIRICPGRKLAMVVMKVIISFLIHQFDFELVNPNEQIKLRFAVFNQPDELYVRIKKRLF